MNDEEIELMVKFKLYQGKMEQLELQILDALEAVGKDTEMSQLDFLCAMTRVWVTMVTIYAKDLKERGFPVDIAEYMKKSAIMLLDREMGDGREG